MTFKTKTFSYDTRVLAFWTLISIFAVCLVVYVWAVRTTISNTITRGQLEGVSANLSAEVGEMEFKYISMQNNVSLQVAYERGFQNVSEPLYISRNTARALSMNVVRNSATLSR
jgi:hypothetical protein